MKDARVGTRCILAIITKQEHEEYFYLINRLSTLRSLEIIILKNIEVKIDFDAIKEEKIQLLRQLRSWWMGVMDKYSFFLCSEKTIHVDPLKYEIYEVIK